MTRWYVQRGYFFEAKRYVWIAESADGNWHEFETWSEAQDYADKQARTVKVVLPRDSIHTPNFMVTPQALLVKRDSDVFAGESGVLIPEGDLHPVALALLSWYYKLKILEMEKQNESTNC